ncbi:uncharacterized protein LOC134706540 isoform X2 [Mytilus trossulus]|uniref:uncharacterized protein LOC134706540 isoform X2 n=1 Tax=Mytilus trossulus TaxID=6551 RepID=UPI0030058F73
MTVITAKHSLKKNVTNSVRSRTPVYMSTPQMTRTGLFSACVALTPRYHSIKSTTRVQRSLNYSTVKVTPVKQKKFSSKIPTMLQSTRRNASSIKKAKKQKSLHNKSSVQPNPTKRRLFGNQKNSSYKSKSPTTVLTDITNHQTDIPPESDLHSYQVDSPSESATHHLQEHSSPIATHQEKPVLKDTSFVHSKNSTKQVADDCVIIPKYYDCNSNIVTLDRKQKKSKKPSKKSKRSRQRCGCIICVMENSKFVFSTELLFTSCVKFVLKFLSCVDGFFQCKKFSGSGTV